MSSPIFDELQAIHAAQGPAPTIERLIALLRSEKRFHQLFDALLMKRRLELGLPLARPTSLKDVPEEHQAGFERYYIDTAREVGRLLLAEGAIPQAWSYFRAIDEPQPVAEAIERLPDDAAIDEQTTEIAFFHGVAPAKGVQLFLASHGTCGTITALDQQMSQLSPAARAGCARILVRKFHDELRANVEHDVQRREELVAPGQSLRELIAGRETLFADGNYHLDVSHLNAVVRFARCLEPSSPDLELALQMAEYGARLAPQYQYAGNPPFDDFYPAHQRYFEALGGIERERAIEWFRAKIGDDPSQSDTQVSAYVLVDLLQRLGLEEEAVEIACRHLAESAAEFGLSLPEMCGRTGRYDLLARLARDREDPVSYVTALIGEAR